MTYLDPSVPRNGSPASAGQATRPCGLRRAPMRRAFSLVEMVTAMAIITVLAGVAGPAVKGLTGSNSLNTGVRKFSGLLSLARNEAITRHTVVRFVVATDWAGKTDANLRRVSLWAWDAHRESDGDTDRADSNYYYPLTAWEELPVGVLLDPQANESSYLKDSSYGQADRAAVRGDYLLKPDFGTQADFEAANGNEKVTSRFIEFLPNGSARIPGGSSRQAIFVTAQGYRNPDGTLTYTTNSEGHPANWAQVNVDTLTGRVRIYRP